MKICYYPGCTLKTKAKDLDVYARRSAAALGVEMEEIENWQCCGARVSHGEGRDCNQAVRRPRFRIRETQRR